jgi:sugar O-acyltransferase (sialic acid O-acetyltransferase NeuD family)
MLPIIILGAGGHARVLADALRPADVLGFTDSDVLKSGMKLLNISVLGSDDIVLSYAPAEIQLVNGLGSIGGTAEGISRRAKLFQDFKQRGYRFRSVVHSSATVAEEVALGEGVQIMAGTVLQTGCRIGANTIVNTRASVDHDCRIGSHVHIAPGVTLSGDVEIGDHTHIGAGATIIQGVHVGANCHVAAGAVVVNDVPAGALMMGVPAKEVRK